MIAKRVYAELNIPSCYFSKANSFRDNDKLIGVKGFVPNIHQRYQCFNLFLKNTSTISNENFIETTNAVVNEIFNTGELPTDYYEKIKFFQAASKELDLEFIKHCINEVLEKLSNEACIIFIECENVKQISNYWCALCEKCNKIEFLIYCLPHANVIDFFCKQWTNILSHDQKESIKEIVINDFEKFENETIGDMKEIFDFLCKLGLYSNDFFLNVESIVLKYFKTTEEEMDQVNLVERLQPLADKIDFAVHFASYLLNSSDIKRLTCDMNEEFSIYIFDGLESDLPCLIESRRIQDIKLFLNILNAINKSSQFIDLLESIFISFAENVLKSSSPNDLFHNLNDISSYLLNLINIFGKQGQDTLLSSFRKIVNKDPNHIAMIVAIGIDRAFRKHLDYDISTFFFLFKLLQSKDMFEVYHSNLLMKRIKHNNGNVLLPDITLTEEIRSYCGDYYTKRFDLLISGAEFSRKCFDSFCNEFYVPEVFHVFLIDSKLLSILSTKLSKQDESKKLPAVVRIISAQYFGFLRDNYPNRKYQWCLQMSEIELKCSEIDKFTTITNILINSKIESNDTFENEIIVRCNAYCAAIILSFNTQNGQSLQEIIEKTNLSANEVEGILKVLSSSKNNLIYKDSDKYYINYHPKKKKIKVPSLISVDSINEENNRGHIVDNQIDCLIIKILKDQRMMNKKDLFKNLIDDIGNQVTEEKFIDRIENMKRKCFLSENNHGAISYIP